MTHTETLCATTSRHRGLLMHSLFRAKTPRCGEPSGCPGLSKCQFFLTRTGTGDGTSVVQAASWSAHGKIDISILLPCLPYLYSHINNRCHSYNGYSKLTPPAPYKVWKGDPLSLRTLKWETHLCLSTNTDCVAGEMVVQNNVKQ